jgi:hypothetical protein
MVLVGSFVSMKMIQKLQSKVVNLPHKRFHSPKKVKDGRIYTVNVVLWTKRDLVPVNSSLKIFINRWRSSGGVSCFTMTNGSYKRSIVGIFRFPQCPSDYLGS